MLGQDNPVGEHIPKTQMKKLGNAAWHKAKRPKREPGEAESLAIVALFNQSRYAEAENHARAMTAHFPRYGFGWKALGAVLQQQGRHEEALVVLQQATILLKDDAEAHSNLGNALKETGRLLEAEASLRRALKLHPESAVAYSNLGTVFEAQGRFTEAEDCYRRALEINPEYTEVLNNLGNALNAQGRLIEAEVCLRRTLSAKPQYAEAHSNLGNTLKAQNRLAEAETSYRRALELKPGFAWAHSNLGGVLNEMGRLEEAEASYRRALEFKPDSAKLHSNLAGVLKDRGQLVEAEAIYRRALAIEPDSAKVHSNLLFTLNYNCSRTPEFCLDEARRYGQTVEKKVGKQFADWRCSLQPRRLRVGFVSGDLYSHPVGYFLEELLAQLDQSRIELVAYPTRNKDDSLTARIRPRFAAWHSIMGMTDEAAAGHIHADGVHVLLDLAGHTAHNRLPLFAWKPAPVQASWLGYFATSGVAQMDYLLADAMSVPELQRVHFTETIWYLPDTRLCFSPPEINLPVSPLPALATNGNINLGCFQNLAKAGDRVLAAWAKILAALSGARLRWQCRQLGDRSVMKQLAQRLSQHGIDPARVAMYGQVPRDAYLAAHAEVDFILDTFPYPGGTTTCEALWMGVPTLTLADDRMLARQGASLLMAAGLSEWVAVSEAEYVEKAIALGRNVAKLSLLRAGLRAQVLASPVFDAQRFARNFEAALWGMWRERSQSSLQSQRNDRIDHGVLGSLPKEAR